MTMGKKVDLSKGYWNPKRKMWVATHNQTTINLKKHENTTNVWQFLSKF